jgi:hypothetical protein
LKIKGKKKKKKRCWNILSPTPLFPLNVSKKRILFNTSGHRNVEQAVSLFKDISLILNGFEQAHSLFYA